MKERPILFSGPMVRAILSGAKTETRRVVKLTARQAAWGDLRACPSAEWHIDGAQFGHPKGGPYTFVACPYGLPGDRLWVRETWRATAADEEAEHVRLTYRADGSTQWERFTGEQNGADERDAWCERWLNRGMGAWQSSIYMPRWASRLTLLVESVHVERLHDITDEGARAEGNWDENPWVWVICFSRTEGA